MMQRNGFRLPFARNYQQTSREACCFSMMCDWASKKEKLPPEAK
jgi:hypothetical protein